MRRYTALLMCLIATSSAWSQDVIERAYFPRAQARNAAIAAARYAEEGYHYTQFSTYVSAVDSSRIYADTALFFVKRSLMLCDTSFFHAPKSNTEAIEFLLSGKSRNLSADSVIRGYYPMRELNSHHYFGRKAMYHLSNSVMDLFSASLLLRPEDESNSAQIEQYNVLPFDDEVQRLEADETAFQHLANSYEHDVQQFESLAADIRKVIRTTTDQKTRAKLRNWEDDITIQLTESASGIEMASFRIQEIRTLLDKKYLKDLANMEAPEHLSQFETNRLRAQKVTIDEALPEGLLYKIQLGYYPSDVDVNNFRGLFPITGETLKAGTTRFFAGLFFTYIDASQGLEYVRNNAIANAFIVPFHNGQKISMGRAVEIEKARGIK